MPASFRVTNFQYYCDDPFTKDDFLFSCQTYTGLIILLLLLLYCRIQKYLYIVEKWATQYPANIFGLRRVWIIMYALVETFGCSTSCARVYILLYFIYYSGISYFNNNKVKSRRRTKEKMKDEWNKENFVIYNIKIIITIGTRAARKSSFWLQWY